MHTPMASCTLQVQIWPVTGLLASIGQGRNWRWNWKNLGVPSSQDSGDNILPAAVTYRLTGCTLGFVPRCWKISKDASLRVANV
jgi:hypothetical protein